MIFHVDRQAGHFYDQIIEDLVVELVEFLEREEFLADALHEIVLTLEQLYGPRVDLCLTLQRKDHRVRIKEQFEDWV